MTTDLMTLEKALGMLGGALAYRASNVSKDDSDLGEHLTCSALFAFEFCYDAATRVLQRCVADVGGPAQTAEPAALTAMVDLARRYRLTCATPGEWARYHLDRTSLFQVLAEDRFEEIVDRLPSFLAEARRVLLAAIELDAHKNAPLPLAS